MKPKRPLILGGVVVLFVASLAINGILFRQGYWFYVQLNQVRLDPLGLRAHSSHANADVAVRDRPLVVFYGDSRTVSWPDPAVPGFTFVNRGIGGETSSQTLLRVDYHLAPLQPDVVIVQTCINDLKVIPVLPKQSDRIVANCQDNLDRIAARVREMGGTVVLTTVFPTGEVPFYRRPFWSTEVSRAIERVNRHIRSLKGPGVVVYDSYAALLGADGTINPDYSADLLHLNDAGYEALNRGLQPVLASIEAACE